MNELTTKRSFDSQAMWGIDVLGLFVDMLSMGVCTTRQWQTSGRLVQELDASQVSDLCSNLLKFSTLSLPLNISII